MVKKLIVIALFVVFITSTSLAFAESVLITKNGKKYHKATCQLVKNKETTQIDDAEAIKQGYIPCAKCYKTAPVKQDKK